MSRRGESISGHKYLYRVGSPGSYRYVYKLSDGSHRNVGPEDAAQYKLAQREHVSRLLAGRTEGDRVGHHTMTNEDIAQMTGTAIGSVRASHANIGRRPHDFEAHQLLEAHHRDPGGADYHAHNASVHGIEHANHVRAHQASDRAIAASARVAPSERAPDDRPIGSRTERPSDRATPEEQSAAREAHARRVRTPPVDSARATLDLIDGPRPSHTSPTVHMIPDTEIPTGWTRSGDAHGIVGTEIGGQRFEVTRDPTTGKYKTWVKNHPSAGAGARPLSRRDFDTLDAAVQKVRFPGPYERAAAREALGTSAPAEGAPFASMDESHGPATPPTAEAAAERISTATRAARSAPPTEETKEQKIARLVQELAQNHNHHFAPPPPEHAPEAVSAAVDRAASVSRRESEPVAPPTATPAAPAPTPPADSPAAVEARAASARIEAAASPSTPESAELSAHDPDFGRSEAALRDMAASRESGDNPYLTRAKAVYDKIKAELSEERRTVVGHMLTAITQARHEHEVQGTPLSQELVTAYYQRLMPRSRGISQGAKDDLERGTGFTFDEIVTNPQVNSEVERMKRGFAAKQMARLEEYVNADFRARRSAYQTANPGKTIYPTYDDLMTWREWSTATGKEKPPHATSHGRTQKAHPKEFFDTMVKAPDDDGVLKVQNPPAWLPLHLTPVWNYSAKKSLSEGTKPYTADTGMSAVGDGQRINMPARSPRDESIFRRALRKYVVFRGGEDQLVDIPSNKLAEMGMTHTDLYKGSSFSGQFSDDQLRRLITTKIIDPVALMSFVKKGLKKSFVLVIDEDAEYFSGETMLKSMVKRPDLKKSRIDRIRSVLRERTAR